MLGKTYRPLALPSWWSFLWFTLSNWWSIIFYVVVFALFFFLAGKPLGLSEEEQLRRGQQAMQQFVRDVNLAEDNRYQASSCPICLDSFDDLPPQV